MIEIEEEEKLIPILKELSFKNNNVYSAKIIEYIQNKGVVSFLKLLCIAEVLIENNINIEDVNTQDVVRILENKNG